MAIGPDPKGAFVALNRFAFGARGGAFDLARAASDPRGFLKAELQQPAITQLNASTLPPTKIALQAVFIEQQQKKMERENVVAGKTPGAAVTSVSTDDAHRLAAGKVDAPSSDETMGATGSQSMATAGSPAPTGVPKPAEPPIAQKFLRADAMARFRCAAHADVGFAERLVHFWSNHFCVSVAKGPNVRAIAGSFEREAIRPHVLDRFADMLKAVEQHPAMLFYLDNAQSFGPNSKAGQNRKRGLNENLAREILELHTLGVDGGYTQADVTSLARILTGWTFAGGEGRLAEPGTFVFFGNAHEPGDQALMGKVYPAGGMEQGETALSDLARHPATAQHIARKLARHFVADNPPGSLVARLATAFRDTDGDLKSVTIALVDSDEAWTAPLSKMRTPEEFMMAALRAIDRMPDDPGPILGPLAAMGMPLWQPPGPNGWPDTVDAWASPEGMKSRLDASAAMAARLKNLINPSELLDTVAGEAASTETRQAVARAESRQQGLAMLFMSPEFQRR
ncbi:MAG TPA: DUF1800 family protein [Methylocella sp.]